MWTKPQEFGFGHVKFETFFMRLEIWMDGFGV